jgi:hypothetical protein
MVSEWGVGGTGVGVVQLMLRVVFLVIELAS